jgi:hypothetical protein
LDSATDLCGYVEGLWNYKNEVNVMDVMDAITAKMKNHLYQPNDIIVHKKDLYKFKKSAK